MRTTELDVHAFRYRNTIDALRSSRKMFSIFHLIENLLRLFSSVLSLESFQQKFTRLYTHKRLMLLLIQVALIRLELSMQPRCCRRRLDVSVCDTTRERCRIRFDLKCHDISEENMPLAKCRYALNAFPSFLVAKMRIHTVVKCFSLFSVTFLLFLFLSR